MEFWSLFYQRTKNSRKQLPHETHTCISDRLKNARGDYRQSDLIGIWTHWHPAFCYVGLNSLLGHSGAKYNIGEIFKS